jgi:O-antigen ligase
VLIKNLQFRVLGIFDRKDHTFNMRLAVWEGGWLVFKDHPLTGCGFKCMDLIHRKYPDPTGLIERLRGMHNNFIQLAVDTGILGLSTWLGIWVCFFILLFRRFKVKERNSHQRWIAYASSAVVIAFLAGGCFETNFYDSEVNMLLWFIMAMPFAEPDTDKSIRLNEEV